MDGPCSDQFHQPTQPKPSYDLAREALLHGKNLSEEFHHPEILPAEPKPSYDLAREALLPGENLSQESHHPEILPTEPKPSHDLAREALLPGENQSQEFYHPEILPTEPKPSHDLAREALLPGENLSQEFHHSEILPTEPKPSYDLAREALLPGEYLSQEYHHPEILQLPTLSQATSSCDVDFEFQVPQHAIPYQSCGGRISLSPSTGKTPKQEREVVDELVVILMECMGEVNTRSREALLRKFFTEIERDERLERFIVERLRQSKVIAIGELCEKLPESGQDRVRSVEGDRAMANKDDEYCYVSSRGLSESIEELSLKLERFKVKTPDFGVMIEEDKVLE